MVVPKRDQVLEAIPSHNEPSMSTDESLRGELYSKYLSSFKGDPRKIVQEAKFHEWCSYRIGPWLRDLPRDSRILDIGCGPGYMLGYLKSQGFSNSIGIDLSQEQIDIAKSLGHNAEYANAFDFLVSNPSTFDLIIAFDFFEHFSKSELRRLLRLIYESLRPNGKLILQTPNGTGLFAGFIIYGDLTHETILSPQSLHQLLTLAGFENPQWNESGPVPIRLTGILRCFAWSIIRLAAMTANRIATSRKQLIWTDNMLCCSEKH